MSLFTLHISKWRFCVFALDKQAFLFHVNGPADPVASCHLLVDHV